MTVNWDAAPAADPDQNVWDMLDGIPPLPDAARLSGCGSHDCVWGHPGGMGTNGACHCLDDIGRSLNFKRKIEIQRGIQALRAAEDHAWHSRDKEIKRLMQLIITEYDAFKASYLEADELRAANVGRNPISDGFPCYGLLPGPMTILATLSSYTA